MRKAKISIGFYYSLTNNYFLNVAAKIAKGQEGWLPGMAKAVTQQVSIHRHGAASDDILVIDLTR